MASLSRGGLAGCDPFHQAINLRSDVIECCLLEFVCGRPVHQRLRCARVHSKVVDGGAPDPQPYAYDKPEDKSHCPFSLLMVRHDAFRRGRADPPPQSLPYAKI